jgi:hypothetical protein
MTRGCSRADNNLPQLRQRVGAGMIPFLIPPLPELERTTQHGQ